MRQRLSAYQLISLSALFLTMLLLAGQAWGATYPRLVTEDWADALVYGKTTVAAQEYFIAETDNGDEIARATTFSGTYNVVYDFNDPIYMVWVPSCNDGTVIAMTYDDDGTVERFLWKSVDGGDNFGDNDPDYDDGDPVYSTGVDTAAEIYIARVLRPSSFAEIDSDSWLIGEYNTDNEATILIRSDDAGSTWSKACVWNTADAGDGNPQIRHIHGLHSEGGYIYILTGDDNAECCIMKWDGSTALVDNTIASNTGLTAYSCGSQAHRIVQVAIKDDYLYWAADSDNVASCQNVYRLPTSLSGTPEELHALKYHYYGAEAFNLDGNLFVFDTHNLNDGYGTDDSGGTSATVLTDSGQSWKTDQLIGRTVYNMTESATQKCYGVITDNDGTTVTCAAGLTGTCSGNGEWDNGETYEIEDGMGRKWVYSSSNGSAWAESCSIGFEKCTSGNTIIFAWTDGTYLYIADDNDMAGKKNGAQAVKCALGDSWNPARHPVEILSPVYWVDGVTGDDADSGNSPALAKATVEGMLEGNDIVQGAKVNVADGEYTGARDITGQFADADVTGETSGPTVIEGESLAAIISKTDGAGDNLFRLNVEEGAVILKDMTLADNESDDSAAFIPVNLRGGDLELRDCVVGDSATDYTLSMITETSTGGNRLALYRNRISMVNTSSDYIFFNSLAGLTLIAHQNIFVGGKYQLQLGNTHATPPDIIGNVFYDYNSTGLRCSNAGVGDLTVKNNIFYGVASNDQTIADTTNGINETNVSHNCYGNSNTDNNVTDSNTVSADPLFVSAGSDFGLAKDSSCIGAGVYVSGVDEDYRGRAVRKNKVDIGAYQSQQPTFLLDGEIPVTSHRP